MQKLKSSIKLKPTPSFLFWEKKGLDYNVNISKSWKKKHNCSLTNNAQKECARGH
jgi:hypothetical protein